MNYEVGTRLLVQSPKHDNIVELLVVEHSEKCIKLEFLTSNYKGDCIWVLKSQKEIAEEWSLIEVINPKQPF